MESKSLSAKFIDTYNRLDHYIRQQLNPKDGEGHSKLLDKIQTPLITKHVYKLKSYAKLRNAIIHDSSEHAKPIAEPHENIVNDYEQLVNEILNPPTVLESNITITKENITTTTLNKTALSIMKIMGDNCYTHIPVIDDNNTLVGIFSENVILSYLRQESSQIIINEHTLIKNFADYLPHHKHTGEYFKFIKPNTTVIEVEDLFKSMFSENKLLAVIYVTENGDSEGKLLGMITPWDVLGQA